MNYKIQKTMYLYKIIEDISNNFEIINTKYKKQFLKKILSLSNNKLEKIIKLLIEWEKEIRKNREISKYKTLIEENRFMEKFINYNKIKNII